jgi:hypothetical protein
MDLRQTQPHRFRGRVRFTYSGQGIHALTMADIFFYCNSFAIAKRQPPWFVNISAEIRLSRPKAAGFSTKVGRVTQNLRRSNRAQPLPAFPHVEITSVRAFNMIIIIL